MQRIPNPGSDPDIFLRIFRELHESLHHYPEFGLDNISRAMIARSNVTSQGAIGDEALRRSTRKDRSRDPIYNQAKMYAELYRTLGWIQSTATSKLTYAFSLLGDHIASAHDPAPLMRECLLGIAYPNEVLGVQSDQTVRIFGSILRTMNALGSLSRDEIIAGPMSITDDTDGTAFAAMVRRLRDCRTNPGVLDAWIESIAAARRISRKPTMENYTRFPIAVLPWSGWATKQTRGELAITEVGKAMVRRLERAPDFRLADFNRIADEAKPAFIRWTFYSMLERAGFNIDPVRDSLDEASTILARHGLPSTGDMFFSPFQQLSRNHLGQWTPEIVPAGASVAAKASEALIEAMGSGRPADRTRSSLIFELTEQAATMAQDTSALQAEIRNTLGAAGSPDAAIDALVAANARANRDVFYPLVANLFRVLGFDCRISRAGQNYERADALIVDEAHSMTIEIKSPGEETEISVKGVRQALENKVVLLARRSYATDWDTTTLVVGFNPPNERSEVHELVDDIFNAFRIRVGVIDFPSLVRLAVLTVHSGRQLNLHHLYQLRGVIRVAPPAPTN